ncbi:unnamed protein product [Haemonchus placei]|uniref:DUF5659 domain-containing protein n=1 Tax=Haemonchus placei TaxID=6290 RepID=A0A0N4WZF1_HAEPC|nr:unnamed protein product [Haemonchus placei]
MDEFRFVDICNQSGLACAKVHNGNFFDSMGSKLSVFPCVSFVQAESIERHLTDSN